VHGCWRFRSTSRSPAGNYRSATRFYGIGAYTAALFTMKLNAPFGIALLAGGLLPAFVALIIGAPTLRLSGVYLAMATLGFGEVVR